MSGIDLETIRQEGSWKSLRMVERYAAVSAAHRQRAMAKLKVTLGKAWAIANYGSGENYADQQIRPHAAFLDMEGVSGSIPLPPTIPSNTSL